MLVKVAKRVNQNIKEKDVKNGKFVPATELEVLEEQKKFIELVELKLNI